MTFLVLTSAKRINVFVVNVKEIVFLHSPCFIIVLDECRLCMLFCFVVMLLKVSMIFFQIMIILVVTIVKDGGEVIFCHVGDF